MTDSKSWGSFTLPGEAGYEELTLKMAKKWGADVIRDSDGTVLSDDIVNAGYSIYSTICIIREHNEWAKKNLDKLQQCFLMTSPQVATLDSLRITLMDDYFAMQFQINDKEESMKYWQVYDRTTNLEIDRDKWNYDKDTGSIIIQSIKPWHKYTVSFLAYRIWEEISMYNHVTNNWNKEHLMQIDPIHKDAQEYLLDWLNNWCQSHPKTNVVRFTSLFYNFAWIWGSSDRNRYLFSDWGSYDFTVSPLALDQFSLRYGYCLTAEDFINQGKFRVSHIPCDKHKIDWMEFINNFVIDFGKQLIDVVHQYGKLAYIFFDDSWIGVEPYNDNFHKFGFDGLIKCIFSGYEARLCADVDVPTHEIRLHPYLFPIGLGGAPTFTKGGNPTIDAMKYWINIRRALLRAPIDRIGLGGYLHLVEEFPDFCDYIEKIADEFRLIKELHKAGDPYRIKTKVAVLHSWGKMRSWTLSGHFHETYMHDLIHVNESLSGLPIDVSFINFDDIKEGVLDTFDIIINAGSSNTAWSGGRHWTDDEVAENITKWVYEGGTFIGINEPSAVEGYDHYFRMAHILGIDKDNGDRVSHGKWQYTLNEEDSILPNNFFIKPKHNLYLTDGKTKVLAEVNGLPTLTSYSFGKGNGIYLSSFEYSLENTRLLLNLVLYTAKEDWDGKYITDNPLTECTYFPSSKTLVVLNNSDHQQITSINTEYGKKTVTLDPYDNRIMHIGF
jgi:beta-D-galactosyl-(1->4)-L-rhamnose phosphorylase